MTNKLKLIDELSKKLRKNKNEIERTLNKLIDLELIDRDYEEETNENNEDNQKQ